MALNFTEQTFKSANLLWTLISATCIEHTVKPNRQTKITFAPVVAIAGEKTS